MNKFPRVMGILNVTPDSFSDGGQFFDADSAFSRAEKLISDGADIIDIGGESTRPGAHEVTIEEELGRVIPVIKKIKDKFPQQAVSIDTTKYEVAAAAVESGATIINDISGLQFEPRLGELAAASGAELIIMHIQGIPRIMQKNPVYDNVTEEIFSFLEKQVALAMSFGVQKIIADPGIGFGKNLEHNLELLRNLQRFRELGVPIMLGISRKAFIGRTLGIEDPQDRDIATALIHAIMLKDGPEMIRVHNVGLISTLKKLYNAIYP